MQPQAAANGRGAEVVIIGAAALLYFVDLGRFTRDVDLVVTLDLTDFAAFAAELAALGWARERRVEHRWRAPKAQSSTCFPPVRNFAPRATSSGRRVNSR